MKKILFVDDEPGVLEQFRRTLPQQPDKWELVFACGAEAALSALEAHTFDAVVADMKMPVMDGAALLRQVRERHPNAVRIIVGSRADAESAVRVATVAHQFLLKPCDLNALRVAIGRATNLSKSLDTKAITRIIGSVQQLPALPRTYAALQKALTNPDVSFDQIARIIEQDVTISAKVLQLANSSMFGSRHAIATVNNAVNYLGVKILQQLALSAEVFCVFKDSQRIPGFSLEDVYAHSQLTARIAGEMRVSELMPEAPVVAGLLHDVGKLVLAATVPAEFARLLGLAQRQQRPLHEVEYEVWGLSHAEVGAYLMGLWGLPCVVVEAVAHHHKPLVHLQRKLDAVTGLHLANQLAHQQAAIAAGQAEAGAASLDMEFLQELGVADRLPEWTAAAAAAAREMAAAPAA